jgi:hypothetical protein
VLLRRVVAGWKVIALDEELAPFGFKQHSFHCPGRPLVVNIPLDNS